MRGLIIFLVIVLVLGGIAYFGTLKFINTKGKDILVNYVENSFAAQAHIGSLYFKFPFNIEIKDFSCEDVSFKRANIFGGFYNPFTKKLVLNSVVVEGFDIKVQRDRGRIYINPVYTKNKRGNKVKISGNGGFIMPSAFAQEALAADALEQEKKFSFKAGSVFLKDARIQFIDLTLGGPVTFNFENTNLKVNNFEYPNLKKFKIDISSILRTDNVKEGNDIDVKGWVDYFYKNMNVNVSMDNVDGYTFNDYYPSFWKLEKFGIKDATLSLKANLNSQHNDLVIDGTMSLEAIDFVEEKEEISDKMKYLKTVIALLKGSKDKASINVKLKTKMDSPKLDFASVKNNFKGIVKIGTASVVGDIIGKIKEAKSDTCEACGENQETVKQAVNDTVEKVKDVVDTLKDLF